MWWLAYPLLGVVAGFIAGLFGVGGGLTMVPLLSMVFTAQRLPQAHQMHLALGTSMAAIVFTSLSSMRAHHLYGAVRWEIVRSMAPGLVLGTLGGSLVVGSVAARPLAAAFTVIVYAVSIQLVVARGPRPSGRLPGPWGLFSVGAGIGGVSSLVAAGGGFLSIPFLVFCNVAIHQAVGTSAALGFPIALAGAVGYVMSGWRAPGLPSFALGYVYLPALLGVAAVTTLTAPLGARAAHRLPVRKLRLAFAGLLALMATKMAAGLL